MARLNLTIAHGQDLESAGKRFEQAIAAAVRDHGRHFQQVEWADDRRSVTLAGHGFKVIVSYDESHVHAEGEVPLAFKLLELPIRLYVARTLAGPLEPDTLR